MTGFEMLSLFAQDETIGAGAGVVAFLCPLVLYLVFSWLCLYKVFEKAGIPGWHCFVPILNAVDLLTIAGRPVWWIILLIIPFVSLIAMIFVCIDIARKFGQSGAFAVGLILLGIVFFPILGFGDAKYNKAA